VNGSSFYSEVSGAQSLLQMKPQGNGQRTEMTMDRVGRGREGGTGGGRGVLDKDISFGEPVHATEEEGEGEGGETRVGSQGCLQRLRQCVQP